MRKEFTIVSYPYFLAFLIAASASPYCSAQGEWQFAGGDLHNTRSSPVESKIGPTNVAQLAPKWTFTTGGDVSATPTVSGDALYVPDWAGNLYRLNAETGGIIWSKKVGDYISMDGAVSRTSPAIAGDRIIVGTQAGGYILAVNSETGALIWKFQADPNQFAIITQSPIVHNGTVYVGVSSLEESAQSRIPGYVPSFRGSVMALDAATGALLWRTYTVPDGYTGGAVWGSTPVVDTARNSLYVGTGNNYSIPSAAQQCVDQVRSKPASNPTDEAAAEEACLAPDDYIDTILSLDLHTGAIKWSRRVQGADTWTVACLPSGGVNPCPDPSSPDFDFGSGPNLFTVAGTGKPQQLLGIGQKSGVYFALNPDTGAVVWATPVGPGSSVGGIEWGSATDGQRVYVAIANRNHQSYRLGGPSGPEYNAGSWAALDAATGRILWQVKVSGQDPVDPGFGAMGLGAVSVANGVVYAGSMSGDMVALDASTGATLKTIPTAGSVICGPSIRNGTVFWGSGYGNLHLGTPNAAGPQLFALTVN